MRLRQVDTAEFGHDAIAPRFAHAGIDTGTVEGNDQTARTILAAAEVDIVDGWATGSRPTIR